MDELKVKTLFVLVCFVMGSLTMLITRNNNIRVERDLEIISMVSDLAGEVENLQCRLESLEGRPEIMIQNATVFNTEEEIIIKETN